MRWIFKSICLCVQFYKLNWVRRLSVHSLMEDIAVNISGVTKLRRNLRCHKATCLYGVPAWLLKQMAEEVPPVSSNFHLAGFTGPGLYTFLSRWSHWSSQYFRKGNISAESNYCRPHSPPSSSVFSSYTPRKFETCPWRLHKVQLCRCRYTKVQVKILFIF